MKNVSKRHCPKDRLHDKFVRKHLKMAQTKHEKAHKCNPKKGSKPKIKKRTAITNNPVKIISENQGFERT